MNLKPRRLFENIWRIPQDYASKSIFKSQLPLQANPQHVLDIVSSTRLVYLSPYDSAFILNLLLQRPIKARKDGITLRAKSATVASCLFKRHALYESCMNRLLSNVLLYRIELYPYFLELFAQLQYTPGISSILNAIQVTGCASKYNLHVLVNILELIVPLGFNEKDCQETYTRSLKNIIDHIYERIKVQNKGDLSCGSISLDSRLLARILHVFSKVLPEFLDNSVNTFVFLKQVDSLFNASGLDLPPRLLVKLLIGAFNLNLVNDAIIKSASRVVLERISDFELQELNLLISCFQEHFGSADSGKGASCTNININLGGATNFKKTSPSPPSSSAIKYLLQKLIEAQKLHDTKRFIDRQVTIPPEAIIALARTHTAFQNDKTTLSYEAARLIGNAVEFRLKQIIQMAQRFMISSLRPHKVPTLLPIDVNNALITLKMPVVDGYSSYYDYRYIRATKLYKGNRVIKREYNIRKVTDEKFLGRFKLVELIQQDMVCAIPASPGLSVHWLVVNNKVPLVASNLGTCCTREFIKRAQQQILLKHASKVDFLNVSDANQRLDNMSKLAATFFQRSSTIKDLDGSITSEAILDAINRQLLTSDGAGHSQSKVVVLPRVEHLLTKEHVFFLKEIRNTIRRAATCLDPEAHSQLAKVFGILRNSPALGQLLPELAHFFASEMQNSQVQDVSVLIKFAEATCANDKIQIHSHAHQFLVPLLNVLLGPDPDADARRPSAIYTRLQHRKLAAAAIGKVSSHLKSHKNGLEGIDSILMAIYKRAIAQDKCTLPILYGALCGIENLPLEAKRILFYPLVPLLLNLVFALYSQARKTLATRKGQDSRLYEFKTMLCDQVLTVILGILYKSGFEHFSYLLDAVVGYKAPIANSQAAGANLAIADANKDAASSIYMVVDDETVQVPLHVANTLADFSSCNSELLAPIYCAILSRSSDLRGCTDSAVLARFDKVVSTHPAGVEHENADGVGVEGTDAVTVLKGSRVELQEIANAKRFLEHYNAAHGKRRRTGKNKADGSLSKLTSAMGRGVKAHSDEDDDAVDQKAKQKETERLQASIDQLHLLFNAGNMLELFI